MIGISKVLLSIAFPSIKGLSGAYLPTCKVIRVSSIKSIWLALTIYNKFNYKHQALYSTVGLKYHMNSWCNLYLPLISIIIDPTENWKCYN